jgi:hypothetical protein
LSPLTTTRALGAALVLFTALPAHAGDAAPLRDTAASPAAFATGLAPPPGEAPLFVLPGAGDGRSTHDARDESQSEQRALRRFETESAPRLAAFGLLEGGGDPLERLAFRGSRRAGLALELPYGALWTASAGSLRPRADWAQGPILRGETSVIFPLGDRFAFKTTLVDHYDASPTAEDADANTFQTLVGISMLF